MRSPIDRIENVRASVDDVERQMQACQAAGVQIPPNLAWRQSGMSALGIPELENENG